eukprot:3915421-Prymnesium_polylepis.1
MAGVYAVRQAGSAGGRRARTPSAASTASASRVRWPRGSRFELRHGMRVLCVHGVAGGCA